MDVVMKLKTINDWPVACLYQRAFPTKKTGFYFKVFFLYFLKVVGLLAIFSWRKHYLLAKKKQKSKNKNKQKSNTKESQDMSEQEVVDIHKKNEWSKTNEKQQILFF